MTGFVYQYYPTELPIILEYSLSALFDSVATGHIWLLSTSNVATETWNRIFNFV